MISGFLNAAVDVDVDVNRFWRSGGGDAGFWRARVRRRGALLIVEEKSFDVNVRGWLICDFYGGSLKF
jgi:hypothetical protein